MNFPGDAVKTFHALCDEQGHVWQQAFFCDVLSGRDMEDEELEQDNAPELIRRASKKPTTSSKTSGSRDSTVLPQQMPTCFAGSKDGQSNFEPEEEDMPKKSTMQNKLPIKRSLSMVEQGPPHCDDTAEEELPVVTRVKSRESSRTLTAPADRHKNNREEIPEGDRKTRGRKGGPRSIEAAKAAQASVRGNKSTTRSHKNDQAESAAAPRHQSSSRLKSQSMQQKSSGGNRHGHSGQSKRRER